MHAKLHLGLHVSAGDSWAGIENQVATLLRALSTYPQLDLSTIVLQDGRLARELRSFGIAVRIVNEEQKSFPRLISDCSPEDPVAIAAAGQTLAAMSTDERRAMGSRARRYIEEHHDFTMLARRLEFVLQSALASSQGVQSKVPSIEVG
jgi:glycosyltransferase involved in cell wall biosynthesis